MTERGHRILRRRRGAALATALFALVMMAAIADALLAPALASRRAARRLAAHYAAESEAERALGAVAGEWSVAQLRAVAIDAEQVTVRTVVVAGVAASGVRVETRVRRIGATLFWVAAEATAALQDAPAAARRSVLLELVRDSIRLTAAVTAGGDIALGAEAVVALTTDCMEPGEPVPASLIASLGARVTRGGLATDEGVRDSVAVSAATYLAPAGLELATLVREAAARLPAGTIITPAPRESGGECLHDPTNWGGPAPGACATHAPVIVAHGDLRVRGGVGQGVLVVNGRLVIEGPFQYRGLIVATGGIETMGGPVTIDGAVLTSVHGDASLHDATAVTASACALSAAAEATARVAVVPLRGWWR